MDALDGVAIFERDFDDALLLAWVFPVLSSADEVLIREHLNVALSMPFYYSRCGAHWFYSFQKTLVDPEDRSAPIPKHDVNSLHLVVFSKELHPPKYESLAATLMELYVASSQKTSVLLQHYLTVFGTGRLKSGSFDLDSHAGAYRPSGIQILALVRDFFATSSSVSEVASEEVPGPVVSSDDDEASRASRNATAVNGLVDLWTAMMLQRKIVVRASSPDELMKVVPLLPFVFTPHRSSLSTTEESADANAKSHDRVRILVDFSSQAQLADLLSTGQHFVAGTLSDDVEEDSYDVLLDTTNHAVTVSGRCRYLFERTNAHESLAAVFNVVGARTDLQDDEDRLEMAGERLTARIEKESMRLVGQLRKLHESVGEQLTVEDFKQLQLSPALESFLVNIALAEGLISVE